MCIVLSKHGSDHSELLYHDLLSHLAVDAYKDANDSSRFDITLRNIIKLNVSLGMRCVKCVTLNRMCRSITIL